MEMERKENVVVVGHQAVLRCILGYFLEVPEEKMPYIEIPLHSVIKITPVAYGCKVLRFLKFQFLERETSSILASSAFIKCYWLFLF